MAAARKAVANTPLNQLLGKTDETAVLSIDVGGTRVRAAVVREGGQVGEEEIESEEWGEQRSKQEVGERIQRVAERALHGREVDVVAVCTPGQVREGEEGEVSVGGMAVFDWGENDTLEVGSLLGSLGRVKVFEDSLSALAAESGSKGAGWLAGRVGLVATGTGLGTAVTGEAGIELGHVPLVAASSSSERCLCGQYGCAEVLWRQKGSEAEALAQVILLLLRAFSPDVIVVAGWGIALLPRVRRLVAAHGWPSDAAVPLSPAAVSQPQLLGSAILASQRLSSVGYRLVRAQPCHRAALFRVCLLTGDGQGGDGSTLFAGREELLGQLFVGPYLDVHPELAFALLDPNGEAVGYVLGCPDSTLFRRKCAESYWPSLLSSCPQLAQEALFVEHAFGPGSSGGEYEESYPAHLHIDLLPSAQNQGFGRLMISRLLDSLRGLLAPGVHLSMMASNARAGGFYRKLGFDKIAETDHDWIMAKSLE